MKPHYFNVKYLVPYLKLIHLSLDFTENNFCRILIANKNISSA